jgi:hypothetical protein
MTRGACKLQDGEDMRRARLSIVIIGVIALLALGSYLLYGRCTWFVMREVLGPAGDLTLPLPQGCMISDDQPPLGLLRALDEEKQKRGLVFEKLVTCRMPAGHGPVELPLGRDPRWLPSYVCCTWQYRRHVVIQVPGAVESGDPSLVVTYVALVPPRVRYAEQIGGCDHKFQAWR